MQKNQPKSKKNSEKSVREESNAEVRINKYLAESGIASRRKAEEFIKDGLVKVNGKVITDLAFKVKNTDRVLVDGDPIKSKEKFVYIILNKPKDIITSVSDELGRKTVLDLVKTFARVFPVGRLDRNTTGLLLLTNDGELAYRLTHPKFKIERIYTVSLDKKLLLEHAREISSGIILDDEKTQPCEIFINPDDKSKLTIALKEGRNREVRRLFENFGYKVKQLDRKFFANLSVKGLQKGEYRHLSRKELLDLKKIVGLL